MNYRKILSVIVGFGTIGILSSLFARIQGWLFASSLEIFINQQLAATNISQFVIKLFCVWVSCFLGGIATTRIGGKARENLIVGGLIMLVVGWLWLSAGNPVWFWLLLVLGILPCVFLGYKVNYDMSKT
ncbi:hypothetical protein SAMN04487995_5967 [Dyadobacter koreensis]|uniref:Major facilitator superfamily (MFS) profile domain-containing protein n=1 Tax=Dyadobacter koreensis TaxID=408657 RepID=A0A1H7AVF0_9BACT|nr:hypothetical protein [Dyadobacter koreensis]SEJ69268.1 hypothetical protein SAMN04487995_5967 [Dyadobacter koreensis]